MLHFLAPQQIFLFERDTVFKRLDHVAIVVPDADKALKIWSDRLGFQELFREKVNNNSTLLVHINLGNTDLQIVQPLTSDHPLWKWLEHNERSRPASSRSGCR